MLVWPECFSVAIAPDTKFAPVMTVFTDSPAYPASGSIFLMMGLAAVVVVAVATVVITVVASVVVTVVDAAVGTDETITWVIFTLYTFSKTERVWVSVSEFVRYPHVPLVFL